MDMTQSDEELIPLIIWSSCWSFFDDGLIGGGCAALSIIFLSGVAGIGDETNKLEGVS